MGIELIIAEELATTSVTLTELSSISQIINSLVKKPDFSTPFNNMVSELAKCYDVVTANLGVFCELGDEASFTSRFESCRNAYSECYLKEISRPRSYSDEAYEIYLVLKTLKESKTGYPLLKQTFTRLDAFVDKWVTNDAWLAMSIDNLFKRMNQFLNEIAEFMQKDPDDAFILYHSAFSEFADYLALIADKRRHLLAG